LRRSVSIVLRLLKLNIRRKLVFSFTCRPPLSQSKQLLVPARESRSVWVASHSECKNSCQLSENETKFFGCPGRGEVTTPAELSRLACFMSVVLVDWTTLIRLVKYQKISGKTPELNRKYLLYLPRQHPRTRILPAKLLVAHLVNPQLVHNMMAEQCAHFLSWQLHSKFLYPVCTSECTRHGSPNPHTLTL